MTETKAYAVVIGWWNGSGYGIDTEDVRVFLDKAVADQYAAEMRAKFGADADVNVADATIQ